MQKIIIFSIFLLFQISNAFADKQKVTVWNYYLTPPFYNSDSSGLAFDFVNILNELTTQYEFELNSVPRARLNVYLNKNKQGIVLFVNKLWMNDDSNTQYLWTPAILFDQNEVVSSVENKVNYKNPDSLIGLKFGAVRGRGFKPLNSHFTSNKIKRVDVNREEQLLKLLIKGRIDITSLPRTSVNYLCQSLDFKGKLYFSPMHLYSFSRHIMITPRLDNVHSELLNVVNKLNTNLGWQAILKKYQLAGTEQGLDIQIDSCK